MALKKRIIPCLDVQDGRTVKGVNFKSIRDAGDPVTLGKAYAEQGADELVFLDITATIEERSTFLHLVERIAQEVDIPFTVGGGVSSVAHVRSLLQAGADKIAVNSAAVKRPELISELAAAFGNQCIVVAVDTDLVDGVWKVFTHGGRQATSIPTLDWVQEIEERGGGEILLTSMQHDGTKAGFAVDLLAQVAQLVQVPVIASGGAGTCAHFSEVLRVADAALAASIFHYNEISIPTLKEYLRNENIAIR